ncbi:hypothetical protein [Saccharopolyspora taberi]|uniref:hypothetical protein n=1 Tax=Saccharopolyspora taberi TaxID=60895 RepID=UPI0031D84B57
MTVTRRLDVVYAEALEDDAELGGQRCDDLVEAASYWRRAGEHERAERALLAAVAADDGRGFFDPKATYAEFLMANGRQAEADRLFAELLRSRSTREQTYLAAATAYSRARRTREALRWTNVGVQRLAPDGFEPDFGGGDRGYELLALRRELRRGLGAPADALDELFDAATRRGDELRDRIRRLRQRTS